MEEIADVAPNCVNIKQLRLPSYNYSLELTERIGKFLEITRSITSLSTGCTLPLHKGLLKDTFPPTARALESETLTRIIENKRANYKCFYRDRISASIKKEIKEIVEARVNKNL